MQFSHLRMCKSHLKTTATTITVTIHVYVLHLNAFVFRYSSSPIKPGGV